MKIDELQRLKDSIVEAHAYRERLGGYSTDANTITQLYALLSMVVQHLIDEEAERQNTSAKIKVVRNHLDKEYGVSKKKKK